MSDNKEQEPKKVLSLSGRGKLELKRAPDSTSQVRQSFSHGRSKAVTVEVKTQRARAPLSPLPGRNRIRRPAAPRRRPLYAPGCSPAS
jgi:translation initiation factor IF-2